MYYSFLIAAILALRRPGGGYLPAVLERAFKAEQLAGYLASVLFPLCRSLLEPID